MPFVLLLLALGGGIGGLATHHRLTKHNREQHMSPDVGARYGRHTDPTVDPDTGQPMDGSDPYGGGGAGDFSAGSGDPGQTGLSPNLNSTAGVDLGPLAPAAAPGPDVSTPEQSFVAGGGAPVASVTSHMAPHVTGHRVSPSVSERGPGFIPRSGGTQNLAPTGRTRGQRASNNGGIVDPFAHHKATKRKKKTEPKRKVRRK